MASWFTVYCSRSVRHVTAQILKSVLERVDFIPVAEEFGIEDDLVVERAIRNLKVEAVVGDGDLWFRVFYGPAGRKVVLGADDP